MKSFGRQKAPRCIEPGEWPEPSGRRRVLIENPDRADLWAHEEALREAGYDVATCTGPTAETGRVRWFPRRALFDESEPVGREERLLCPLTEGRRCSLVEGADVVVSTTSLVDSRRILAAHGSSDRPALVVEGPSHALERDGDRIGTAAVIEQPVTEARLLAAVADALANG